MMKTSEVVMVAVQLAISNQVGNVQEVQPLKKTIAWKFAEIQLTCSNMDAKISIQ